MALVSKILETTLTAGSTSVTFTDSDIPNSLIRVFSSDSNIIPESRILSGNTLTVTYAPQTSNIGVALEIVKQGLDIVNNLIDGGTDKALSAEQGHLLKNDIDGVAEDLSTLTETVNDLDIPDNITDLDDVNVTSIQDGQVLAWDEDTGKFVNVSQSSSNFVGIDTSTVIYSSGNITSNFEQFSYVASTDCWLVGLLSGNGSSAAIIYLNGVNCLTNPVNTALTFSPIPLKAGDTLTLRSLTNIYYNITIYGIK